MRTGNPALSEKSFSGFHAGAVGAGTQTMTIEGTINKTGILLLLAVATASLSWMEAMRGGAMTGAMLVGGAIVGFIFALITIFKKEWAPVTAPLYALAEGLFLGAFSAQMAMAYDAIIMQALSLTFGVLFTMLAVYRAGLIKVTDKFRSGITMAIGGIALTYLLTIILGFFGITVPYIHGSGMFGIIFSLVVVGVAAFSLLLDFDFIEKAAGRSPKYMEWYGAFGLMVTLVWLYIELVRLLAKFNSRD